MKRRYVRYWFFQFQDLLVNGYSASLGAMLTDQREEIDCKPKAGLNKSSMRCGEEKSSEYPMIEKEEEMELILEDDALTRDELRTLAGKYDLDKVNYLELSINTADRSVEVLGDYLPNLQQLRLHQSRVQSFRDFGTSLRNLRILWVNRCGITELDGIGSLIGLHELYLAFNDIRDIGPIAMHDELQVLGKFILLSLSFKAETDR